ncbi:MAG: UDP-3-O-(3-hydroxymyristoyl)glucosamine N-acyltransferase [Bacteroidales bacterium]|nr:UDP-3-O-(3-hydroxymyristoyl)glucosamine N-acyltransferase [Bacteroidales bacterium]MDZ4204170.1 UDP-3-O-(3-hydroxymyristoyl)glucosamine N-acyltransferase [Bacteroidales bacterium]
MQLNPTSTLSKIAGIIQAEFEGDPDFLVSGLNEIHVVQPGDLTFVDHPKYYKKALSSAATTILINKKVEKPIGKVLIFSDDPFGDYTNLVKHFIQFQPADRMISTSAIIGPGTILQPGAFIGNHVLIGNNCLIHANVSIYDRTEIGDNVIIHSGTVIGADAFYFQRRPAGYRKLESCGKVIIEENVEMGACCTIDRGVSGVTKIGAGTKFDNHVHVGHDTVVGKNCLFASAVLLAGMVTIEDDVILWGQVVVQKGVTIGKSAVILATSGVDKSLEGGKIYFGIPAIEARKKWRELAALKQLPDLLAKL